MTVVIPTSIVLAFHPTNLIRKESVRRKKNS